MTPFITSAISALIPLIIGFVWYHPKVFGNAWMKANGLTEESLKKGNMAVIFGLTYLFSFMLSFMMLGIVRHEMGMFSLVVDGSKEVSDMAMAIAAAVGDRYSTFKHGALHGTISAIFFALPVLGINALFERKGGKYIFIHLGYWIVTLALIGGIMCQFTLLDGK
ncbi:MAG: DUF1761 domain-containing protein [Sphingobacteriales bacterium JAD_PAG50586_3]|nr:MAG: DUF1761 domain-containing protein [Sphingobacteriales bacterium JAD_PAG50586_3]